MTIELKLGPNSCTVDPQNPRVLLGRDEQSCGLWVHDQSVSRRHAEVFLDGGGNVFLRDLGSSNGTWHDGKRITYREIQDRDQRGCRNPYVDGGITLETGEAVGRDTDHGQGLPVDVHGRADSCRIAPSPNNAIQPPITHRPIGGKLSSLLAISHRLVD